jgi:hypothetical protein
MLEEPWPVACKMLARYLSSTLSMAFAGVKKAVYIEHNATCRCDERPTEGAEIIRGPVVRPNQAGIAFRLVISFVINRRRQRDAGGSGPTIKRDKIIVLVPSGLGLLLDDSENLINRSIPYRKAINKWVTRLDATYNCRS